MSKWRPAPECIYVIPDIHGHYSCLDQVLGRILPLRPNDQIVFLGDYVDRGPDSHKVIDKLVELTDEYDKQVTCLMGNHEWLFMASVGLTNPITPPRMPSPLQIWLEHGGINTIQSYCDSIGCANLGIDDYRSFPIHRIKDIIPDKHKDFLFNKIYSSYEYDNYIFVHAGCDPTQSLDNQPNDILLWDRSLYNLALSCIVKGREMPWKKTVVTGHNYNGPIITPNFMMLDCSGRQRLLCTELNSMEGFYAFSGRTRMLRANLEETTKLPKYITKNL
jgi:serine/threonine protein phosphatase 1